MMTSPNETEAWITVRLTNGRQIRSNSYTWSPEGVEFVSVLDASDNQLGWWHVSSWADPVTAPATLAAIAQAACDPELHGDAGYVSELYAGLARGQLRISTNGQYLYFMNVLGQEHDDGAAFYAIEELIESPGSVMGAIMGCICELGA